VFWFFTRGAAEILFFFFFFFFFFGFNPHPELKPTRPDGVWGALARTEDLRANRISYFKAPRRGKMIFRDQNLTQKKSFLPKMFNNGSRRRGCLQELNTQSRAREK